MYVYVVHIYYIFSLYTTLILFVLDFSSEELDIYYRHEGVGRDTKRETLGCEGVPFSEGQQTTHYI